MTAPATRRSPPARAWSTITGRICAIAGCHGEAQVDTPAVINQPASEGLSHVTSGASVIATGLTKIYPGPVVGAQNISLRADPGEIVGVLGPNGAGKSTTLNMLSTLLRPTGGSASVAGISINDPEKVRKLLGVALQSSGLDPYMTGKEHFDVQAPLYGVELEEAARHRDQLLSLFGLQSFANREVRFYSGGLQRRLALALALVHDPPVIIFDEPTTGLDPQSRRMMWELLRDLRSKGRTIIFSTQSLEEADVLCQRVYVIANGTVIAEGTPDELRAMVGGLTMRVRFRSEPDARRAAATIGPELGESHMVGDQLVFPHAQRPADARKLLGVCEREGLDVLEFVLGRPTLEEAFIGLTGVAVGPEPPVKPPPAKVCRCH